jgi:hypothetical protein
MIDSQTVVDDVIVSDKMHEFECLDLNTFEESMDLSILISDEDEEEMAILHTVDTASNDGEIIPSTSFPCEDSTDVYYGSLSDYSLGEHFEDGAFCSDTVVSDDEESKYNGSDNSDDDNDDAIKTAMKKLDECMKRTSETRRLIEMTHAFNKELMSRKRAVSSLKLKKMIHRGSPQTAIKIKSALCKLNCRSAIPTVIKPLGNKLIVKNFASTGCQNKLIDVFLRETARCKSSNIKPTIQVRTFQHAEKTSSVVDFLRNHQRKKESPVFRAR